MSYLRSTEAVLWPLIFIATDSATRAFADCARHCDEDRETTIHRTAIGAPYRFRICALSVVAPSPTISDTNTREVDPGKIAPIKDGFEQAAVQLLVQSSETVIAAHSARAERIENPTREGLGEGKAVPNITRERCRDAVSENARKCDLNHITGALPQLRWN